MWLPWKAALVAAAVLGVAWSVARRRPGDRNRLSVSIYKEAGLTFVIYAGWIRLGEARLMATDGAAARGRWIWRAERWLPFPSERKLQHWTTHATWLIRFANVYYIVGHVAPLGIFLVWLFFRHGEAFPRWRNQLAFVSIVGVVIQFVPVAPPRLYPELGFVDTAVRYGPRVYDNAGFAQVGQLAAMPSMHVAWAMFIAVALVSVSGSRWRWLGLLHAGLTVFAVTVTANHWILDGLVATAILFAGLGIERAWGRLTARSARPDELADARRPAN